MAFLFLFYAHECGEHLCLISYEREYAEVCCYYVYFYQICLCRRLTNRDVCDTMYFVFKYFKYFKRTLSIVPDSV